MNKPKGKTHLLNYRKYSRVTPIELPKITPLIKSTLK
jgi:hypothetical protein